MIAATFASTARFVWSRNRKLLAALGAIYLVLFICSELLPPELVRAYLPPAFSFLRLTPFFVPMILFVSSVGLATMELVSPEGHFPRHFFTLPVKATQIVLPFMVYAVAAAALLWTLGSLISDGRTLLFGPPGTPPAAEVRLIWIPFLSMSGLAWFQALSWNPFPRRWLRVWALLAVVLMHGIVVFLVAEGAIGTGGAIAISVALLPFAYLVAARGVSRDRSGGFDRTPSRSAADAATAAAAPSTRSGRVALLRPVERFTSGVDAQTWFERRIHRWTGTVTLFIAIPFVVLALLVTAALTGGAEKNPEALAGLARAVIFLIAGMLPMIAIATGFSFASFRFAAKWNAQNAFTMPAFFAALPMSTGEFVWAKIKAVTINMTWICVGALITCAWAADLGGLVDFSSGWVGAMRHQRGDFVAGTMLALPAIASALFLLSSTANIMCMTLPGRTWNWISLVNSVIFMGFGITASGIASRWGKYAAPPDWLPATIQVIAIVKLLALAGLLYHVASRRLLGWNRLATILAFWLATAGSALAAIEWYAPEGVISLFTALCTVVTFAPVLGVVAAPLALQMNRAR